MSPLSNYVYSSLQPDPQDPSKNATSTPRFRILFLDPGQDSDDISCCLETYPITSPPDFEAISYAWGDRADTADIACSGQQLRITKSLFSALRRFRLPTQKRTLWADAICINQKDIPERNAQVAIMGRIFSSACQVLIWLGEESVSDAGAFEAVSHIDKILPTPPQGDIAELQAFNTTELFLGLAHQIPQSSWHKLGCLLLKPWFQRVWIIQEVLLARSAQLHIGSTSMAWRSFEATMSKILVLRFEALLLGFAQAGSVLRSISLIFSDEQEWRRPFSRILCHTRDFKSLDPRDKIYAVLGVADPKDVSWKNADYGITASDLFVRFTKQELAAGSLIHLSATNYVNEDAQLALPSWVPDWSLGVDSPPLGSLGITFAAGGKTAPRLKVSSSHDLLTISGKKISLVSKLGTRRYHECNSAALSINPTAGAKARETIMRTWCLNWLGQCQEVAFGDDLLLTQEFCATEIYRRFCKALYSYNGSDSEMVNSAVDRLSRLYLLLVDSLAQGDCTPLKVDKDSTDITTTFFDLDRLLAPIAGSKYFGCDTSGRYGWFTKRARVGDVICIFYGAGAPHLLRPVANGRYELIGECYLQGCEDGALMDDSSFALEEFVII